MNKIIKIILLFNILMSPGYTKINQDYIEVYWENSRAEHMFKFFKNTLEESLFKMFQVQKEDTTSVLKNEIDIFINNPKYIKEYKNIFLAMDITVLKNLNKFYTTNLGKKYKVLSDEIVNSSHVDVRNKYSELIKNNSISKEKMSLILDIDKELNIVDIKIKLKRKLVSYQQEVFYPNNKISSLEIDKYMENYKNSILEYESMLMPVLYNKFTIEELRKILKYSSSKTLAIEIEYIYLGAHEFTKQALLNLKNNMYKLKNIQLCQNFNTMNSPSFCQKEWLNNEESSVIGIK